MTRPGSRPRLDGLKGGQGRSAEDVAISGIVAGVGGILFIVAIVVALVSEAFAG